MCVSVSSNPSHQLRHEVITYYQAPTWINGCTLGMGKIHVSSEVGCNRECQSQLITRAGRVIEWYFFLSFSGVPSFPHYWAYYFVTEWVGKYASIIIIYVSCIMYLSSYLSILLYYITIPFTKYLHNVYSIHLFLYQSFYRSIYLTLKEYSSKHLIPCQHTSDWPTNQRQKPCAPALPVIRLTKGWSLASYASNWKIQQILIYLYMDISH